MDVNDGLNIGDRPMLTRHHSKSRLGKLSFYFDEINKPIEENDRIEKLGKTGCKSTSYCKQ